MTSAQLLQSIFDTALNNGYSDIHISTGMKPKIRDNNGYIGDIESVVIEGQTLTPGIISKEVILQIIEQIAGKSGVLNFIEKKELDTSYELDNNERYRVNCYMDSAGYSIALRHIPSNIPTLESLGLPDHIREMCNKSKGLILVTGPTGSGKSTNLAAMINYINTHHKKHIITIEDPIEFAFNSDRSLINQREVGNTTHSFPDAIRSSLREDPDVIMIGEMRDTETIQSAIRLAETGHLVISTLHTNDSVQTIDRIVDIFPGPQQTQVRMQLSQSLIGILAQ
ncbi:PilT/PilU family type 4a pilus ATPase, partial [Candidatus Gracilibacteria bacterium]|nr:PilT/PilU family type 4a pilus ATPase [Candidatus Gracilibacteria bacterium]